MTAALGLHPKHRQPLELLSRQEYNDPEQRNIYNSTIHVTTEGQQALSNSCDFDLVPITTRDFVEVKFLHPFFSLSLELTFSTSSN